MATAPTSAHVDRKGPAVGGEVDWSNQALSSIRPPPALARRPTSSDGILVAHGSALLGPDPVFVVRRGAVERHVEEDLVALGDVDGDGQAAFLAQLHQEQPQVEGIVLAERRELQLPDLGRRSWPIRASSAPAAVPRRNRGRRRAKHALPESVASWPQDPNTVHESAPKTPRSDDGPTIYRPAGCKLDQPTRADLLRQGSAAVGHHWQCQGTAGGR